MTGATRFVDSRISTEFFLETHVASLFSAFFFCVRCVHFLFFFSKISADNDKEKILQILGRVSEKKKLDKLKQKYKELYDKVRK